MAKQVKSKRGKATNRRGLMGGHRHRNGSKSARPLCEVCLRPFTRIDRHERVELCRCHEQMSEVSAMQHFVQIFGPGAAR